MEKNINGPLEKVLPEEHSKENAAKEKNNIYLLSIIGEIEGHEAVSGPAKSTKYEEILPKLAAIENSEEIDGVLVLLNTMG